MDKVCNYHPITLVPAVSGTGKSISNQMVIFLDKINILSNLQFGLRNSVSIKDVTASIINNITETLNK
jgi:hypothetical protein